MARDADAEIALLDLDLRQLGLLQERRQVADQVPVDLRLLLLRHASLPFARSGGQGGKAVDRQKIRFGTEPADDTFGNSGKRRVVTKVLAGKNVRQMHFYHRRVDRPDGI